MFKKHYHSSSSPTEVDSIANLSTKLELNSAFLKWLSGFVDAEGNFGIRHNSKTKQLAFVFRIHLHLDDLAVLQRIKNELSLIAGREIGGISINGKKNTAELTIGEFNIIKNLIIPILNEYPLRTTKYLDFKDWEKACLLAKQCSTRGLPAETLATILELKKGMNTGRTNFDSNLLPQGQLEPLWVVGFWEGDGSFYVRINDLTPVLAMTKKKLLVF